MSKIPPVGGIAGSQPPVLAAVLRLPGGPEEHRRRPLTMDSRAAGHLEPVPAAITGSGKTLLLLRALWTASRSPTPPGARRAAGGRRDAVLRHRVPERAG
ncbi:hypothetical protein ACLQ24_14160 [Micromonospora sp. DT4]|uniref:hypothetical protein n=1 Tax=Micromonospora sp. DT4 TaxID=3393438 RepID=UPI003CFB774E